MSASRPKSTLPPATRLFRTISRWARRQMMPKWQRDYERFRAGR